MNLLQPPPDWLPPARYISIRAADRQGVLLCRRSMTRTVGFMMSNEEIGKEGFHGIA